MVKSPAENLQKLRLRARRGEELLFTMSNLTAKEKFELANWSEEIAKLEQSEAAWEEQREYYQEQFSEY